MRVLGTAFAGSLLAGAMGLLAAAATGAAELPDELPTDWKVGDRYRLELVRDTETSEKGQPAGRTRSSTPIAVEVLSRSDDGYVIQWTFGTTQVEEASAGDEAVERGLATLKDGLEVRIRTDAAGRPTYLENTRHVIRFLRTAGAELTGKLTASGLERKKLADVRKLLSYRTTEETMRDYLLSDPEIFYGVNGLALEPGAQTSTATRIAAGNLEATQTTAVTEADAGAGRAVIERAVTIDDLEQARAKMYKSFSRFAKMSNMPEVKPAAFDDFDVVEKTRYEVDTKSGLPSKVDFETVTTGGGRRKVVRVSFERLPAR